MVDWQQKLTNYISVYLLCSKKFVRNILLLVSRVDPSSFSPEVELVGLLTAASYKGLFPGSGQPTAPSCFLRHQPHFPASAASGFSTFCQQSKARKQCVQAVYTRPGPGSLWGNQTMAVRDKFCSRLVLRSRWKNGADGM